MTELSPLGSVNTLKPQHSGLTREQRHAFSLKQGRAPFGIDMKITGPDGQDQPWDGVSFGDLKVRGPFVCDAYFGDEPGSATDDGGWFATGDVAVIGPDGVMEITDRSKDVIKSGGEWISSITLENLAVSHPDVAEAAVIAARHPKWDERPLLIVRPAAGRTIDTDALMTVFDGQVPNWWRPDAVIVVDDLPHTATGKLQKNVLRSTYGDALIGG
jgi:fatty-acyl-CoA synthase